MPRPEITPAEFHARCERLLRELAEKRGRGGAANDNERPAPRFWWQDDGCDDTGGG